MTKEQEDKLIKEIEYWQWLLLNNKIQDIHKPSEYYQKQLNKGTNKK